MAQGIKGVYEQSAPAASSDQETRLARMLSKGALCVSSGAGVVIDLTPVMDTSIYADNDVAFVPIEVANVSDVKGGVVKLVSGICFDGDDQGTELEVFLTTNSGSVGTINGALSPTDAIADDIVGRLHFVTFNDLINSQQCVLTGQDQIIQLAAGSTSLYAFGVVRSGTPTYTASGVKLKLGFERLG
jgi:hypothetical protein